MKKQKLRWGRVFMVGALLSTLVFGVLAACKEDDLSVVELSEEQIEVIAEAKEFKEEDVQQYMHEITHGFVYANDKWGEYRELNENTIVNLRNIIEAHGKDYKYRTYYLNVLDQWEEGYENMVDVHNFLWDVQGGTKGYATELYSTSEIIGYYWKHFKTKDVYSIEKQEETDAE